MKIANIILLLFANAKVGITNSRVTHVITWDPKVTEELVNGQIYHIDVNLNDYMHIVCPQYHANNPETQVPTFVIYHVGVESFRTCTLTGEARQIIACNTPSISRKLTTIKFQHQSLNPGLGFLYKPNSDNLDYCYMAFVDVEEQGCENAMRLHISVNQT